MRLYLALVTAFASTLMGAAAYSQEEPQAEVWKVPADSLDQASISAFEQQLQEGLRLREAELDMPAEIVLADERGDEGLLKRVLVRDLSINYVNDSIEFDYRLAAAVGKAKFLSDELRAFVIVSDGRAAVGGQTEGLSLDAQQGGKLLAVKLVESLGFDSRTYAQSKFARLPVESTPEGARFRVNGGEWERTNKTLRLRIHEPKAFQVEGENPEGNRCNYQVILSPGELHRPLVLDFE